MIELDDDLAYDAYLDSLVMPGMEDPIDVE